MFKILILFFLNQYQIFPSEEKTYTVPPIEVSAKYPESFLLSKGTSYLVDSSLIETFKFDPSLFNLSFSPSLIVNSYGYPGYLQTGFIRGFSSTRTGIYLEGFKLNSRTSGSFNLSLLSGFPVSGIEVLSSSGSSIYGENALSGALNFKLLRKSGFNFKGGAGNLNTTLFSGSAGLPYTNFYFANYTSIPPEKNKDSHFSRFINIFENKNVKSLFLYSRNSIGNFFSETGREKDEFILTGFKYLSRYFDFGYQFKKDGVEIKDILYSSKDHSISNRIFGDLFLNTEYMKFRTGFEYEKEYLKGTTFENTSPKDERLYPYLTLDLVIQGLIPYFECGKELKGSFNTESPFVYRGGIILFKEAGSIYFNYSKGFRAPTLLDLYWPFDGFSKGNPDLKPETSKEIEGGIKVIEDKSLLLISYFKRELENGITWGFDENFVYTPQNIEKIKLQGFEGLLKIEKVPFIFSLNFIFYKERKSIENDSEKTLLLIPTYNSGFLIGYKERNFSLSYRLRLIGPHYSKDPSDYLVKNVQYAIFQDLSFTLKLSKFINMSLLSTNIDNKPYEFQIGFPLERRRIYGFVESNF